MATQHPDAQAPRGQVTQEQAEQAVRVLLDWVGEDPCRDGLLDTPKRVAKAWLEMTDGMTETPAAHLERQFEVEHDSLVLLRGIRFASLCEHHVLPFIGTVDIGYIPGSKVVGISKLARVAQGFARRLQVQERLTDQIADAMVDRLDARGVMVVIRATHQCMGCRGVLQPDVDMVTSAVRGVFRDDPAARSELLSI